MIEKAYLAGGCFWGMEELFRALPGVVDTQAGYSGGNFPDPTYNDMKTGQTGHAETLEITFDPDIIKFEDLLKFFFQIHDPTTPDRQGNDRGSQYRSAIFFTSPHQQTTALALIEQINKSGKWPAKIVTQLVQADKFYIAEDFHQDYLQKYPNGYTCHWLRPDWTL